MSDAAGSGLRLVIHRAADTIGGNCIELAADGQRLILDAGRPLDAPDGEPTETPASLDLTWPVAGVLLSHAHQDHYGLLEALPADWPVYCGAPSEKLIRLGGRMSGAEPRQTFHNWTSNAAFTVGPFTITPLLTDHSAFDAHMLLIEVETAAGPRRILYSGDFRRHGRKAALVDRLMTQPGEPLDALIMEGTNLGNAKTWISESALEDQFAALFRERPGRVFVAWSGQNVDRTVTLYRACKKAGRTLVVDLYTAEVMDLLGDSPRLPRPGWPNLKVVITGGLSTVYEETGRKDFVERMVRHGVGAAKLAENPAKWVIMTRASLIRDYSFKGVHPGPDDAWVWSLWSGYLDRPRDVKVKEWFEAGGCPAHPLHTSGHASPDDLRAFADAMAPRMLIPVHGHGWDGPEAADFPAIRRLANGETLEL